MRNYLKYSFLAIGFLLYNCSNIYQDEFKISGKVKGEHIDKIYLKYGNCLDSALVSNNSFSVKGLISKPTEGILYPENPSSDEPMTLGVFMLENNDIFISLKYSERQSNGALVKFLDIDSVAGSKNQKLKEAFDIKIVNMVETFNKSDDDSLKRRLLFSNLNEFIKKNPQSILSGKYLASLNSRYDFLDDKQIGSLLNLLDREYQNESDLTRIGSIIAQRKILNIGSIVPSISLPNSEGQLIDIGKFKGNLLLIEFWASWCVPCRQVNPELLKVYKSFEDRNFMILGISLDQNVSDWRAAIEEDGINWIHVIDSERRSQKVFGISSVPFNILLNEKGEIVLRNVTPNRLSKFLKEVLNTKDKN